MPEMIGRTISHYRVVGQLGAGGMGVVYAAADDRLGRSVALKFVPEELANEPQSLERLRSEARTASLLTHPNICTIYDIGEHEGRPFIVMELLKGQTLRERLESRSLRFHEVVDLGIQVADALDWAHTRDVIHRDIKPANLFLLEGGYVKILDFGLAKLMPGRMVAAEATRAATTDMTAAGITLGTVAYMSPEQVAGEELDGRSDLFSLGVVLYECTTGHQPFIGTTSAVVLSAILTRAPTAPVLLKPDLPPRLQDVINNCLEKNRELRYQNAAGLRADLKRLRRDLESGPSNVITSGAIPAGIPPAGVASDSHSSMRRQIEAESPAPPVAPKADSPRGFRFGAAVTALVGLALVATTVFWLWRRTPGPVDQAQGTPDAFVQSRLELASNSLREKKYLLALSYSEEVLRTAPNSVEALRIRDDARAMTARFDEAVARARGLLAAGDSQGATAALDAARVVDPTAAEVIELSARLARSSEATPARPPQTASPRTRPEPQTGLTPVGTPPASSPPVQRAPEAAAPPASAAAPIPIPTPPPAAAAPVSPPAAPVGRATRPDPDPRVSPPAEASTELRPQTAVAPEQVEDDDSAIRKVVASYARAIETKDMSLFRSVKPNLSADEQRRIEEGFRAVTSQRVNIAILSIERRGAEASVRVSRRDVITAGGRQQTAESQQTIRLIRSGANWVIRELGR